MIVKCVTCSSTIEIFYQSNYRYCCHKCVDKFIMNLYVQNHRKDELKKRLKEKGWFYRTNYGYAEIWVKNGHSVYLGPDRDRIVLRRYRID